MLQKEEIKMNLDSNIITSMLKNCPYKIHTVQSIGSTNDELKRLAAQGEGDGYMLFAEQQTAGRGRLGRSFFSPPSGLYMSLLLRPETDPSRTLEFTTSAAVAVCRATEKLTKHEAKIKWVNDIYLNNRKVCGILAESSIKSISGKAVTDWIVVGIGINIAAPKGGFPKNIENRACALFDDESEVPDGFVNTIAAELAEELYVVFNGDSKAITNEYRNRSMLIGKRLTYVSKGEIHRCKAISIDEKAALIVEHENGERVRLQSGEVTVRDIEVSTSCEHKT